MCQQLLVCWNSAAPYNGLILGNKKDTFSVEFFARARKIMQRFIKSFFVSFLVFIPVSGVLTFIFITTISLLSIAGVSNENVRYAIDTYLWSFPGVLYAYMVSFIGTLLYQYGIIT